MSTHVHGNLRFETRKHSKQDYWFLTVTRISDGRHLKQHGFTRDVEPHEWPEVVAGWLEENPGLDVEPPPVLCRACKTALTADHDTTYQFDNALWITLDGGYGMFVESESFMTQSDFWNSLDEATRREHARGEDPHPCPWPLPESLMTQWEEWFEKNRTNRFVICHDCAHDLCNLVPWIEELLNPLQSHSHHVKDIPRLMAEGHRGWDLDRQREEERAQSTDASET